ncbi:hypothetical protein MXEN_09314 [Mycobacterium xenopi RIVM700367]|uniref:universal stress protein n=1 Tax=Mycobacterium xenopi TaxID=1789 RepID=UPI00025AD7D0|nr:universal stress protein [Mycobacterium xenopi]EID14173.1 hypothetical protein MXEN_09314 [Mycobacterium xenopi RIVM700367]
MHSKQSYSGIIVGVDGSHLSKTAVRWAALEAVMRNIPLTLVHVIFAQPWGPTLLGQSAAPVVEPNQHEQEVGRKIIADAIRFVEDSGDAGDLPQIASEVLVGPPVQILVNLSKKAELVVVGCRGQGMLDRILLGSVSTGLVHHAHCPVAVIHGDALLSPRLSTLPVVVGIDGSPASEMATAIAFDEASWRGVELVALHVWRDADEFPIGSAEWSAQQAEAVEALAERLAGWQERYPDVSVHRRIVSGNPARHLIEASESSQLVVVGNRGRGGLQGMLMGSVSTAVVHAARSPVIVVRLHRMESTRGR